MHTKTCASAVKIYLFFLFISLFAVSGCGLDVDFGSGNNENNTAADEETIEGTIKNVPSEHQGASFVVKACVVKDGTIEENCSAIKEDVSEGNEFSLTGNLDPEVELQVFKSGDEDSRIGSTRIDIFPGAKIEIEDLTIETDESIRYDPEETDITFRGKVSDRNHNCTEGNGDLDGRIDVTVSSEDSGTVTITVRLDSTEIYREDDPICEQIASGSDIVVDGKLTNESKTVRATVIEIK